MQTCVIPPAPPVGNFDLVPTYPQARFERALGMGTHQMNPMPLMLGSYGSRNQRLGRIIRIVDGQQPTTFYERTVYRNNNEEGLLGLAFHPDYSTNHKFYVYYSAGAPTRRSVIAEVQRDPANPAQALPGSEKILLEIPQPYGNHNGGDLRFGHDGYLYISVGDGGAAGDPLRSGQDVTTLSARFFESTSTRPIPL